MNMALIVQSGGDLQVAEQLSFTDRMKQRANAMAKDAEFEKYLETSSTNTIKGIKGTMKRLANYLIDKLFVPMLKRAESESDRRECQEALDALRTLEDLNRAPWRYISHGYVVAFRQYLVDDGMSPTSVNPYLSRIRKMALFAYQGGHLSREENEAIQAVKGYKYKEVVNLVSNRAEQGKPTRKGTKKATSTILTKEQIKSLKSDHPDTPQGKRDRLLFCLLVDWGPRCSELAGLTVKSISMESGIWKIWRKKTKQWGKLALKSTPDTWNALQAYLALENAPKEGYLLAGSKSVWIDGDDKKKRKTILRGRMSERAIAARVRRAGDALGLDHLSPHDLRHDAATRLSKILPLDEFMAVFGWTSTSMAVRYINASAVVSQD